MGTPANSGPNDSTLPFVKLMKANVHYKYLSFCQEFSVVPRGCQVQCSLATADDMQLEEQLNVNLRTASSQVVELLRNHYFEKIGALEARCQDISLNREKMNTIYSKCCGVVIDEFLLKSRKVGRDAPHYMTLFLEYAKSGIGNILRDYFPVSEGATDLVALQFIRRERPGVPNSLAAENKSNQIEIDNSDVTHGEPIASIEPHTQESNVINLARDRPLSAPELSLLQKGLSFCPAEKPKYLTLQRDLLQFERKLKLRDHFFQENPVVDTSCDGPMSKFSRSLPSQTQFIPAIYDPAITSFMTAVRRDIDKSFQKNKNRKLRRNLSKPERTVLEKLKADKSIVIKPADKGNSIVILSSDEYLAKIREHLENEKFYKALPSDHFPKIVKAVHKEIDSISGGFDTKVQQFLKPKHPVPGRFYGLPKVHKTNVPLRPIVSQNGTPTEPLSQLADFLTKDLVLSLDTYIRDTDDFQNQISNLVVPDNSILVTIDITALYTNIPHEEGISATLDAYRKFSPIKHQVNDRVLEVLLRAILRNNIFEFDGKLYIQKHGTAMGSKVAPSYANLFMGNFEQRFLDTQEKKPSFIRRFLDDMFMLWTHGKEALLNFLTAMNNFHSDIKITYSFSDTSINFLDVTVVKEHNKLITKLYRKDTDRVGYLHFKSDHPRHVKKALPFSIATRITRRCTREFDRDKNMESLQHNLKSRCYPDGIVENAIQRAKEGDRGTRHVDRNFDQAGTPLFISTYSSNGIDLTRILRRHFNILQSNSLLLKKFPNPPNIVFRRPRNLKDVLVNSKFGASILSPENWGCTACRKPRCQICRVMSTKKFVSSKMGDFKFEIRGSFTCDSSNVVYLLECDSCKVQYIGETGTAFRLRYNNHKHKSKVDNLPIARHIQTTGHSFSNFRVYILAGDFKTPEHRKNIESFLIHRMNTLHAGLNDDPGSFPTFLSQNTPT
jgi:hypothetical protein